ncbi:hypothetical protein F4806DRAFT_499515 [Annulohypoxylon nitens]|nr:hypothetical protein F4806DRAFT_499515 [Annulohypoxylon nitens]
MASSIEDIQAGIQSLNIRPTLPCANNSTDTPPCRNTGSHACSGCLLVARTWQPLWKREQRAQVRKVDAKRLWSDCHAIDFIKLDENEGSDFQGPFDILITESKEARDFILSVVNLPETFRGPLNVVLNELNHVVAIRNVILLLIFCVEEDPVKAAEYALHTWYSLLLTDSCYKLLKKVKSVLQGLYDEIKTEPGDDSAPATKRVRFCKGSIDITLSRGQWLYLPMYAWLNEIEDKMSKSYFQSFRRRQLSTPAANDLLHFTLEPLQPYRRVNKMKFRKDGMLLPFGQSREDFTVPNPLLVNMGSMLDDMSVFSNSWPLMGWSNKSFHEYSMGLAKNDEYGKLNHYLRDIFTQFHQRIRAIPINVAITNITSRLALSSSFEKGRFNRISHNHIVDLSSDDIQEPLKCFAPLLQPASVNRHATLITNTLYTPGELSSSGDGFRYLYPFPHKLDTYFNEFLDTFKIEKLAKDVGLYMKNRNTIVDPWHYKIPGVNTAKDSCGLAIPISAVKERQAVFDKLVEWGRL